MGLDLGDSAPGFHAETTHGLMIAPVLIGLEGAEAAAGATGSHEHLEISVVSTASLATSALGILLHAGAMLLVMGVVAVVIYDKLGLRILQRAWLNTDQLWAATFVMAAGITLVS
jgi:hypothetical protein